MPSRLLIAVGIALLAPRAPAQERQLPPSAEMGRKVFEANTAAVALSTVVIVTGPRDYLDAIAAWKADTRFPVLWDDGSPEAAADIARFVHAFKPARVVRFEPEGVRVLRGDPADRIQAMEHAIFATAGADATSMQQQVDAWRADSKLGPGVVITDVAGDQWPAGVALAAGRRQPLAFTASPGRLSAALTVEDATALETFARTFAEGLGLKVDTLGDDVDAITLALECPAKVRAGETPPNFLATTDYIARNPGEERTRWAYAGHIVGNEARSAYLAMCSLFLRPSSAWIFDAYESGDPWSAYDGTSAGQIISNAGLPATIYDAPKQGLEHWRAAAVRPIDAGLVMVNTMGNADFFRLRPGDGSPGDIPLFATPPIVYFVHSFSAARPGNINTVGGRLLDHGAYVYFGSVQEPMLQAFVPTPKVAQRIVVGLPLAAAMRPDDGPPWKLAYFGDPLACAIPPLQRSEDELPLEHLVDLSANVRTLIGGGQYAEGMRLLGMLDRDEDVARLAAALMEQKPESFDHAAAAAALLPLFGAGRPDEVITCYKRLSPEDQKRTQFLDALWLAARLRMYADTDVANLLAQHLRDDQLAADAIELSRAFAHQYGAQSAIGMLQSVRNRAENEQDRRALDKQIQILLSNKP